MGVELNHDERFQFSEPDKTEVIKEPAISENESVTSEPSDLSVLKELPSSQEDTRIHLQAMTKFAQLNGSYTVPASSLSSRVAITGGDDFASNVAATQENFDKWVKMDSEMTQKQIEQERLDNRSRQKREVQHDIEFQDMKEVREMKERIMDFYKSLIK